MFSVINVTIWKICILLYAKQTPAAIEMYVYMKLLLAVVVFDATSMNSNNITDASDLRAIFYALCIENTIDKFKTLPHFIPFSMVC